MTNISCTVATREEIREWTRQIDPELVILNGPACRLGSDAFIQLQPILWDAGNLYYVNRYTPYWYVARVVASNPIHLVRLIAYMARLADRAGAQMFLSRPIESAVLFNQKLGFEPHPIFEGFRFALVNDLLSHRLLHRYHRD